MSLTWGCQQVIRSDLPLCFKNKKAKKEKKSCTSVKSFSTSHHVAAHGDALMDAIELCSKSTSVSSSRKCLSLVMQFFYLAKALACFTQT
jgi:hypothetical protein